MGPKEQHLRRQISLQRVEAEPKINPTTAIRPDVSTPEKARGCMADFLTKLPQAVYQALLEGHEVVTRQVCLQVHLATGLSPSDVRGYMHEVFDNFHRPLTPGQLRDDINHTLRDPNSGWCVQDAYPARPTETLVRSPGDDHNGNV